MTHKKKKSEKEIEAFLIDANHFYQSVKMLEQYKNSLVLAYKSLEEIEVEKEVLDDMEEQIDVVDSLIYNFRLSVLKTIYGEDSGNPDYH